MATTDLEPLPQGGREVGSGGAAVAPAGLSFPAATFAKLSPLPYLLAHLQPQPSTPWTTSTTTTPSTATAARRRRPNGRRVDQFRTPTAHTGSLSHAEGSAVVRFGDTAVVCGVKAEVLLASDVPAVEQATRRRRPHDVTRERALLVPNVELATGCSPAHLPGQAPSPLAQSLAVRILSLLHCSEVVQEDLRIWYQPPTTTTTTTTTTTAPFGHERQDASPEAEVKAFWTLYIDVLFVSLDGNPFDAAWAAVTAALADVRLPSAYWDADRETVLCDDDPAKARRLRLLRPQHGHVPLACTFAVFTAGSASGAGQTQSQEKKKKKKKKKNQGQETYWLLADPDAFEEEQCLESVTVTVMGSSSSTDDGGGDNSGGSSSKTSNKATNENNPYCPTISSTKTKIIKLEKHGGGIVGKEQLRHMVALASERWRIWQGILEAEMAVK